MSWVNVEKYYVDDSSYLSEYGFLGPYKGERYHIPEFHCRGQPRSWEELIIFQNFIVEVSQEVGSCSIEFIPQFDL